MNPCSSWWWSASSPPSCPPTGVLWIMNYVTVPCCPAFSQLSKTLRTSSDRPQDPKLFIFSIYFNPTVCIDHVRHGAHGGRGRWQGAEGGQLKQHNFGNCGLNEELHGVFESWEQAEQHGNVSDFKTELILVFLSYQSEMINQSFTEWYLRRGAWPACHDVSPPPQCSTWGGRSYPPPGVYAAGEATYLTLTIIV